MQAIAGKPELHASGGMTCLAREYGRFWLAHKARPTPELEVFLQARCGEPVGSTFVLMQPGREPGAPQLEGAWRERLGAMLGQVPGNRRLAVGAWSGESGEEAVVTVALGERLLNLEPVPIDGGSEGLVELRGRFLAPVATVEALVTRGAYGFEPCEADERAALPAFVLRCPVAAADEPAIVEIMFSRPRRVLGARAMLGLLSPGRPAPIEFAARGWSEGTPTGPRDSGALLTAINVLRTTHGLSPLKPMAAQSAVAGRMLPTFLSAMSSGDAPTADTVALGLLAGWEVQGGMIRDADFAAMSIHGGAGIERGLETLLMTPHARALVLDPKAHAVAAAALEQASGQAVASLITTYRFFGTVDYPASEEALLDVLDRRRALIGKPPVIRVGGNSAQPLAEARESIKHGGDAGEALNRALQRLVDEVGIDMRGIVLYTTDLNAINLPPELLVAPRIQIDVDIDHFRPRGSPWGTFMIVTVYTTS